MTPEHDILQVTPRVEALAALCRSNSRIDPALYRKYDVKRGLRDINGQGVLAGLTNISDIISRKEIGGEIVPCEGELYYRGIRIQDLVQGFIRDGRKGYEGCRKWQREYDSLLIFYPYLRSPFAKFPVHLFSVGCGQF